MFNEHASCYLAPINDIRLSQNNPGAGPPQPHRGESFFAIAKSLMVRALIIYFITSMFRRPSVPVEKSGGIPLSAKTASTQIYANGTAFVCKFGLVVICFLDNI